MNFSYKWIVQFRNFDGSSKTEEVKDYSEAVALFKSKAKGYMNADIALARDADPNGLYRYWAWATDQNGHRISCRFAWEGDKCLTTPEQALAGAKVQTTFHDRSDFDTGIPVPLEFLQQENFVDTNPA